MPRSHIDKPSVEQALVFKRLRERDWFGVRDHIIKECLQATGYDVEQAYKYLQGHFAPPRPGHWCPRWHYFEGQPGEEPHDSNDGHVKWHLVRMDGERVIPLDNDLKPINETGRKKVEYWSLNEDGSRGEPGFYDADTDGTEGHPYDTFIAAEAAMLRSGDQGIFLQVPDGRRFCKQLAASQQTDRQPA